MDLLILIHSLASGGAERVATNMANYWYGMGWRVTLITMAPTKHDFFSLEPGVERVSLGLEKDSGTILQALGNNIFRLLALRRILRSKHPDVALSLMTSANVLLALSSIGLPLICVGAEHSHPPRAQLGASWSWLRRFTYGWLDALVVLTRESKEWIERHTHARNVSIIPNPIIWPLPEQCPLVDPMSVGQTGRKRLLAVGRLSRVKGYDILLAAFAELAPKHPEWELVIIGAGPERGALHAYIEASGLSGRAVLAGRVGNLADWYGHAQLFVMTSLHEGFPNVLLEALAHGLPAVSFDCEAGPRNILRHEVDGLLVPDQEIPALVAALDRMMSDTALRETCAARAVEVRTRFSEASIQNMWRNLFNGLLNDKRV